MFQCDSNAVLKRKSSSSSNAQLYFFHHIYYSSLSLPLCQQLRRNDTLSKKCRNSGCRATSLSLMVRLAGFTQDSGLYWCTNHQDNLKFSCEINKISECSFNVCAYLRWCEYSSQNYMLLFCVCEALLMLLNF